MICNYLIDIKNFIKNFNIMFETVTLDNGKDSKKREIKIDHAVNNLFYFTIFLICLPFSSFFSNFLAFLCYKKTNDVNINLFLKNLLTNCIKLY